MRYLPLFAAIFAITPLAIDLYLPAMLLIADDLQTDINAVQNSLSIYLGGYAFGMFLFGPLADRFGRRKLLLCGLTGFTLFSSLLIVANSIESFLILRLGQAMLGGAATVVIPGAIRTLFGKDTAKGLSYVSLIMMLAPMLAPAIGTWILLMSHWRWIFIAIAIYGGVILLVAYRYFPDVIVRTENLAKPPSFLKRYKIVLADNYVHFLLMSSMLASLVFFAYITSVAFIYLKIFSFTEETFSLLFGLNVGGLMLANLINTRLVPRFGSITILKYSAPLCAGVGLLLLIFCSHGGGPWQVIPCLMLLTSLMMLLSTNSDALILQRFTEHAGTATAVIGTLRFGFGALSGPILALFYDGTILPVAVLMTIATTGIFGLIYAHQKLHASELVVE